MAQECAFFNAELNGEEYDRVYLAETFAAYFASFIGNGVYLDSLEDLEVVDQDVPNMSIQVLSGQAWINGYWYRNTTAYTLPISIADGTLARIDRVVLRWDAEARDIYLTVLDGTPSANPVPPAITRNSDYYDLVLAEVSVAAGVTIITQSAITDTRSDPSVCGWVTGVIEQIDLSELYTQWTTFFNEFKQDYTDAFTQWAAQQETDFENWSAAQKNIYNNWIAGCQEDYNTWIAAFELAANTWYSEQQQEFIDWFEHIRDILDDDVAGHLQNEIEALQASDAEHESLLDVIAKMIIENRIAAVAAFSDGSWIELSDGSKLMFQWSYEVSDTLCGSDPDVTT